MATGMVKIQKVERKPGAYVAEPFYFEKVTHHPALKLQDAANWYDDLNKRSGIATDALKFTALTLARSGEVRGADWSEIEDNVWIIQPTGQNKA